MPADHWGMLRGGLNHYHGVGGDPEHPGRAPDAQALGHACKHPPQELDRHAFTVEEGARSFEKVALTPAAIELSPRATARMTVRANIPQPEPAAITAVGIGAEML